MKRTLILFFSLSLLTLTSLAEGKQGWEDNYARALAEARQHNKHLLLDFTGSDWCIFCIKLDNEVFSKPEFKRLAKNDLVLVELDFPEGKSLPRSVEEQNARLKSHFNVMGFPTLILVDAEGHEIDRWVGYNHDLVDELQKKITLLKK